MLHAVLAGITDATSNLGHEDDLFASVEVTDIRTNFCNYSRDFMSLNHGITSIGVDTMVHVDIRTANADALDLDQYFTGKRFRRLDLADFNLTGSGHDSLFHNILVYGNLK
jgi:hypothetical protein